ncbi:MAG: tetratricopeptide repeat protein [Kofleriaceae bacterium]
MRVALFVVICALASPHANADELVPDGPPDILGRAVKALEDGRLTEARDLFRTAYELNPQAKVLFALGQVEFNLDNFAAAVDYYQRFLDTNPEPREAALAQQAIGAARARLAAPRPQVIERPPPRYERDWDVWSTSLVGVGGAAAITGVVVLVHGYRMGQGVRVGEPANLYRDRLERSKRWQWMGLGVASAGTLFVGAALVRFAVHRVEVAPIVPGPSAGAVGLALEHAW